MDTLSRPYQDELLNALMKPAEAAAYLNAALDEGSSELFIIALQNVAQAQLLREQSPSSEQPDNSQHEHPTLDLSEMSDILARVGLRFAIDRRRRPIKFHVASPIKSAHPKRQKLIREKS